MQHPPYQGGSLAAGGAGGSEQTWHLSGFFDEMAADDDLSAQQPLITNHQPLNVTVSPNPFNPMTTISFVLPVASQVTFKVFDIAGRDVSGLGTIPTPGYLDAGTHTITFDGSSLPSGIYFVRIAVGSVQAVKKMVLMK